MIENYTYKVYAKYNNEWKWMGSFPIYLYALLFVIKGWDKDLVFKIVDDHDKNYFKDGKIINDNSI